MKLKTAPVFNNIFPQHITAFTSDRRVDFTIDPGHLGLNYDQREYLRLMAGEDIPEPASLVQEHGDRIHAVESGGELRKGDGLITNIPNCPLSIRTADCLPIFYWDAEINCIALVHAGWKGSLKNIAGRAVDQLSKTFGSRAEDLKIAFGPSICKHCYEVGEEFLEYFPDHTSQEDGKFFFDLSACNAQHLIKSGVMERNILQNDQCTKCLPEYFSYRRDGNKAGRMISLMMINH